MVKVSIIIPFNNAKQYIKQCLEGLEKIEYEDYEIILINDGSKDESEKLIKSYLRNIKIKYHYIKKDSIGVGKARNYGIKKAIGKYIMFIDVDDYIDNRLLLKLDKFIKQEIDLIKYKMRIVKNRMIQDTYGPIFNVINGEDGFNKLCFNDKYFDSPCLYLIKRDLFFKQNLFFSENMYHEDFGLIPVLIALSNSIVSVDFYGYYYIQTKNSIMRDNDYEKEVKKVEDKFFHYSRMVEGIKKSELSSQTVQNIKQYYTNSIIDAIGELGKRCRNKFIKKVKKMGLIHNIKTKNNRSKIKKFLLNFNMNWYYKLVNKK